jgi:hypothetical protein
MCNVTTRIPGSPGRRFVTAAALALVSLLGAPAGALPVDAASDQLTVSAAIPSGAYRITPTQAGHEIEMDGFGALLTPGKPVLPSKIFAIAIPPGAEPIALTVTSDEPIMLPGTYDVPPASLPQVIGEENPALYARDRAMYDRNYNAVYARDEVYPATVAKFVRTARYRAYDLVDVRVTPFGYRPLSGRLMYYPKITVHVHCAMRKRPSSPPQDNLPRTERVAEEIILNYDAAGAWYQTGAPRGRGLHDFVIITLDSLTSRITSLVNWEASKGRTVEVVTTSWIGSNYSGYDLAEKMRNFLREKYPAEQWGIEDVLLIGHYDDVPMRRTAQDMGYGKPETDYYYAELSLPDNESWDANGNHQWGEDSDPIDFYAEVNVGRIPWSDGDTVQHICEKSVAYEENQDSAFKKNILLLGAFFWSDTDNAVLMERKVDEEWMADWTMTRMYEQGYSSYPMDYNLRWTNVRDVWSAGKFAFVNWAGHGSPTSSHIYYSTGEAFVSNDTCDYLNDDYPAIIFADACSNSDTDHLNIGQAMLKQGGIGFLGATKVAYGKHGWNNPNSGSSQSLDYFFTTCLTSGEYTQGAAHQWALREMYTRGLWYYTKYETFEWGALWGNPDLAMAVPSPLSFAFPEGRPEYLAPHEETTILLRIIDGTENYEPGTGLLHYRYDGGTYLTSSLVQVGDDLYEATLPGPDCDDVPEYYFSAETDGGSTVCSPFNAPESVYTAIVGTLVTVIQEDFETDPGWSTQGLWAFGQPTGGGGEYGGPDPTSGYSGPNVYGYNLNGDYENNLPERHLTSDAIDCTGRSEVMLRFYRWLGVEQPTYDHAYVRVSNDGTNWVTVWENAAEIADSSWMLQEFDISAVADNEPTVFLRWTMGSTDGGWRYCGWNIDDVELLAFECSESCPGDFDGDGDVDTADLLFLLAAWGTPDGDMDGDGDTDTADLLALLAAWGECP